MSKRKDIKARQYLMRNSFKALIAAVIIIAAVLVWVWRYRSYMTLRSV